MMNILEWFCICFFFKLYLGISNATPPPKTYVFDATPLGSIGKEELLRKIDKEKLIRKIDNLIEKFKNGEDVQGQVEGPFVVEEELPDEVTITQGYTTISQYLLSWILPGYQPTAIGTKENPLIQHTFKQIKTDAGTMPTYDVKTIAPTNTSQVEEPSRFLSPFQVMKLKKSADKIVQQLCTK